VLTAAPLTDSLEEATTSDLGIPTTSPLAFPVPGLRRLSVTPRGWRHKGSGRGSHSEPDQPPQAAH
jgi:hypothetical protein